MALSIFRGAVGFLTRLPVGTDESAFDAFCSHVGISPLVGYLIGLLAGVVFFVPVGAPTIALLYVVALVALTGINHIDGLADLGDAAVVHGAPAKRRSAMRDTMVGVGGTVAVAMGLAGLLLGALALATIPPVSALGIVVAAEVGAKLGLVTIASVGEPSHGGFGARVLGASPSQVLVGLAVAAPAAILLWPSPAGLAAVLAGPIAGLVLVRWANGALGGVGGDVFGAANEIARIGGLHLGVVLWMHF